jgi:hypothetical protein
MSCDSCDIQALIYRYAQHIDNGDLEGAAALFANGKLVATDAEGRAVDIVGAAAVRALYQSYTRLYEDDGTPHTLHMTTNVLVDVAQDGGSASASSYAMVFQALPDFPLQPIIGVRYHDRFVKAGLAWQFAERRIETYLHGDLSRHLLR